MKRCTRCKEFKQRSEFYKNRSQKDGLQTYCKSCNKAQIEEWRAANPERERARQAARDPEAKKRNYDAWVARRKSAPSEATCQQCGTVFTYQTVAKRRICYECAAINRRKRFEREASCQECGYVFTYTSSPPRKTCSDTCFRKGRSRRALQQQRNYRGQLVGNQ